MIRAPPSPSQHSLAPTRRPSLLPEASRIWFLKDVNARPQGTATEPFSFLCPLVLLRPQDRIILPGKHEQTYHFVEFMRENANLDLAQVVWHEHHSNNQLSIENVAELFRTHIVNPQQAEEAEQSYMLLTSWTSKEQDKFVSLTTRMCGPNGPQIDVLGLDDQNATVLYRHAQNLEQPSMLEEHIGELEGVKLREGYICATTTQLLVAYRLLGASNMVIKPVKPSEGLLYVSSVQELRLYDFPNGPVFIRSRADADRTVDGFPLICTFTYLDGNELGEITEQLMVGTRKAGMRKCTAPAEFRQKAKDVGLKIMSVIRASGPCTIEIFSINGQPVVSDITVGRFSYEHFAKLFYGMYANTEKYLCVSLVAPERLDIWTFYSRLMDQNAAFNPKKANAGVFPLLYLPGVAGTFMIVADTDDEIDRLRVVVEQALAEPLGEVTLEQQTLDDNLRRVWCFGPRPESRLQGQRYNLPSRFLSILRPQKDVMIVPGNHIPTQEFVQFCVGVVGFDLSQVIFTKGESFCLDYDIDDEVIAKLKALITSSPGDNFVLIPYMATENFYRWANQFKELGVGVFGEDAEWLSKYGHKGILHRHIGNLDQPSVIELIDPKIRVAKGYTCSTTSQLLEAYRLIGSKEVVIKPILGSSGDGILFVSDEMELRLYGFPQGDVVLEEKLKLDTAQDGIVLSPAVHYMKGKLLGEEIVDQIMVGVKYMGWRESAVPTTYKKTTLRYTQKLMQVMKPQGPGGFDYLSVDGLPVLSDINTGRFNGAHQPKLFFQMYAPEESKWYCWKKKPPVNLVVNTFWMRMMEAGIAFTPGQSSIGVFPITYLRGSHGTFVAIAPSVDDFGRLKMIADECLLPPPEEDTISDALDVVEDLPAVSANSFLNIRRRVWAQSTIVSEHRQTVYQQVIPVRPLPIMRPQLDLIILPSSQPVREFFEFCKEILGLGPEQVIWTPGLSDALDEEIGDEVLTQIRKWLELPQSGKSRKACLVPYRMCDPFRKWASKLQGDVAVYAEDVKRAPYLNHRAILGRSLENLGEDSWFKKNGIELNCPTGYLCKDTAQLLHASNLLRECDRVVVKPIDTSDGRGIFFVSNNEEELRLYDFHRGPVVLEEFVQGDHGADGLLDNRTVVFIGTQCIGQPVEQLVIGSRVAGIKQTFAPEKDEKTRVAQDLATRVVSCLNPKGPVTVEFMFQNGQPLCSDVNPARFSFEHFAKLFVSMYAPSAVYICVKIVPPEHLDVWTFWSRLLDQNAAFNPAVSTEGVFPMGYLRGLAGTFIVIAHTEEQVQILRVTLEEILAEPLAEASLEQQTLDGTLRRIWCFGPRPESTLGGQRYNLPSRFLSIMRPAKDVMILPGNHLPTQEFVEFCAHVIGFDQSQIIYTKGESFCLDDDIDEEVLGKLKALITSSPGDHFVLIPYIATDNFYRWASKFKDLGVGVFGEDGDWLNTYGHKGILHRHMSDLSKPSILELIDPKIRVAKGYTCSNTQQILEAYRLIGCKEVVIKPILGSAGDGIMFVSDEEQLRLYGFPQGDVVLEEKLKLDTADDGIVLSPAVHYMKAQLLGEELVDQIMVGTRYMGWRESKVPTPYQKTSLRYTHKLIQAMKPQGPGGFDFLSVDGLPVLSDINTGRFNGAHQPKLFFQMYAVEGSHWYCWKFRPPQTLDVHTFWRRLQERGIAFVPAHAHLGGVFPITYLRGKNGTFIAIGENSAKCINLYEAASKCLSVRNTKPNGHTYNRLSSPMVPLPMSPDISGVLAMILLKNATIYAPELVEARNLLIAGSQIVGIPNDATALMIEKLITPNGGIVVDVASDIVVPGFIDIHLHLAGGGGEMGFASKTPEARLSELINGGLTTVVGVLGLDSVTRSEETLFAKVEALNEEGITAYMYTGAYHHPATTITGSVMKDITFLKPVLGVGVAVSDHRACQMGWEDIAAVASQARVAGLVAGKPGVVCCHIGSGRSRLKPLFDVVHNTDIPITQFLPTHMSSSPELLEEGIQWVQAGGYMDLTARDAAARVYLTSIRNRGVPMERIIASSDAFGTLPTYNERGEVINYRSTDAKALVRLVKKMYFEEMWSLETILPLVTTTPATYFKLASKGRIEAGKDADILVLDRATLDLKLVIGKGQFLKTLEWTKKGMFES